MSTTSAPTTAAIRPAANEGQSKKTSSKNNGSVIGAVVGVIIVIAIGCTAWYCYRRRSPAAAANGMRTNKIKETELV